jgi:hypothetical protein
MLAKILHALIDGANMTDNLRGELHALADQLEEKIGASIGRLADPPAAPPEDVSRETPPIQAALCDHGLLTPAPGLCNHDEVTELMPAEAPADDAPDA